LQNFCLLILIYVLRPAIGDFYSSVAGSFARETGISCMYEHFHSLIAYIWPLSNLNCKFKLNSCCGLTGAASGTRNSPTEARFKLNSCCGLTGAASGSRNSPTEARLTIGLTQRFHCRKLQKQSHVVVKLL
jgi:hypothetical protein